jgi:hypothetical protein
MYIEELISRLEEFREEFGNVKVEVRNKAGDFYEVYELEAFPGNTEKTEGIWSIFIYS